MSLLEQDTIRKEQVETAIELDKGNNKEYKRNNKEYKDNSKEYEFDNKEYKVEAICNYEVYTKELDSGHYLPGFYYLVS